LWGRAYLNIASAPGNGDAVIRFGNAESFAFLLGLQINPGLGIVIQNASFGSTHTFPDSTITAGSWFRMEWAITFPLSAAGQVTLNIYTSPDSAVPAATFTSGANQNFGSLACDQVQFGWTGSNANQPNLSFDDLNVNTAGFPGPVHTARSRASLPSLITAL
jgi:hypothetical protein